MPFTSSSLDLDEIPGPSRSNTLSFDLSSLVDFSATSFLFEELIALYLKSMHTHNTDRQHRKLTSYTVYTIYTLLAITCSIKPQNCWFLPRYAMLSAVYAGVVCLSVCLFVTLQYCVKMAKHRITQIMPHDSPETLNADNTVTAAE